MPKTITTKRCSKCKEHKALDCFYNNRSMKDGLSNQCKACHNESQKKTDAKSRPSRRAAARRWQKNNPEAAAEINRRFKLKSQYGITTYEYDALLEVQNGVCAICGGEQQGGRRLAVDHDHVTGKVRGLLCDPCNNGLGRFRDDPDRLRAAALYIERA